jgi:demethylmenaquinone methyltransferase / 2-methoxy-6-polyprenyl-1,4-benzoquinol methylase
MASRYYDPGAQRAAKVSALFGRIAPRYDLINDLQSFGLHRYWKGRVLRLAQAGPGVRALDVCCGTGDLALGLARLGAEVVGLDASEPMLEIARRRAAAAGPAAAVRFLAGDAQRLPFPAGAFEIVTVGYGLRNLADWEAGLGEMVRVAVPGARLAVLDFGKPPNALWRALYYGYLRACVPLLGRCFCGDWGAYAYILESLKHYPAQQGVAGRMRQLGLMEVRVINLLGGAMSINYARKP